MNSGQFSLSEFFTVSAKIITAALPLIGNTSSTPMICLTYGIQIEAGPFIAC
jgi:hypothetical protein